MRQQKIARAVGSVACAATVVTLGLSSSWAVAEEAWGDLRGRLIFGGASPDRPKLALNKDVEYCGQFDPLSENVVVDPKSRGLANVVIWLEPAKDAAAPPVHPSYSGTADDRVVLDNSKCRFDPHVCVLRTSQTLVIGNDDQVSHNAAAFMIRNDPFNVAVPEGDSVERTVEKPEPLPVQITCPIHAWMKAWLVIKDHPYVAVTDSEGRFELKNVPAGRWTFRVWHEAGGYLSNVSRDGRPVNWEKGQVMIDVEPGPNEFGTVTVPPAALRISEVK